MTLRFLADMECVRYYTEEQFQKFYKKHKANWRSHTEIALCIFDDILFNAKPIPQEAEPAEYDYNLL